MLTLLSVAAVLPGLIAPAENVKLVRTYKASETFAYSLDVKMQQDSDERELKAEILFKVAKVESGEATVNMSVRKYSMAQNGSDLGSAPPDDMVSPFDPLGMPHVMAVQGEAWIYIVASFAGLVPGKEVALGESFEFKWSSKDKAFSASGKGKALEVLELDGQKAVKIEYEIEVRPGEEESGRVKCQTLVTLDGSAPLSSEGSVDVGGGKINFKVKRLKA